VGRTDGRRAVEIGQRARDFQNPMAGARRQRVAAGAGFIALLQFAPIRLKTLKPKETDFERHTLGEHLRKRRLELKLTRKEVADLLGVNAWTILNWEKSLTEAPMASIPAIARLLGCYPFSEVKPLSGHSH
jgi:DNA-binding XRE family transcriptional regulator